MDEIRNEAAERLQAWEHQLLRAVEEEPPELERKALTEQLEQLRFAREQLPRLGADEVRRLCDRLARDPGEWIERSRRRAEPAAE